MLNHIKRTGILACLLLAGGMLLSACTAQAEENAAETTPPFTEEDLAQELGIDVEFLDLHPAEEEDSPNRESKTTEAIICREALEFAEWLADFQSVMQVAEIVFG